MFWRASAGSVKTQQQKILAAAQVRGGRIPKPRVVKGRERQRKAVRSNKNDASSPFILLTHHFLLIKFSIGKNLTGCYFPQTKS